MNTDNDKIMIFLERFKKLSEHWTPYYKLCAPCTLNYDYVLRLGDEELKFFFDVINIGSENVRLFWKNRNMQKNSTDETKKREKLAKLYSKVPRNILIQIYLKYKMDYELFGFDFNDVLQLAKKPLLTNSERSMPPKFY